MIAKAHDHLNAKIGERVKIEARPLGRVTAGFHLLILPLLAFIPGYLAGEDIAKTTDTLTQETWGVLTGLITFSVPWVLLFLLNK
jgi:hypothetical protein